MTVPSFISIEEVLDYINEKSENTQEYWKCSDDDKSVIWENVYFKGNYYAILLKANSFLKNQLGYEPIFNENYLFMYQYGPNQIDNKFKTEFDTPEQAIDAFIKESLSRLSIQFEQIDLVLL